MGGEGLLKGGKIDLEVLGLRGDQHHFGPGSLDKHLVLREIGGKHDELVPRAGQPVEHTAEGGRRPHRDVKLIGGIIPAEAAVEGIREALAGRGIPLGAGVAVDQLGLLPQDADGRLIDRVGGGDAGIAQREVVHVLPAHHSSPLIAVLKQLPDHGAGSAQPQHTF